MRRSQNALLASIVRADSIPLHAGQGPGSPCAITRVLPIPLPQSLPPVVPSIGNLFCAIETSTDEKAVVTGFLNEVLPAMCANVALACLLTSASSSRVFVRHVEDQTAQAQDVLFRRRRSPGRNTPDAGMLVHAGMRFSEEMRREHPFLGDLRLSDRVDAFVCAHLIAGHRFLGNLILGRQPGEAPFDVTDQLKLCAVAGQLSAKLAQLSSGAPRSPRFENLSPRAKEVAFFVGKGLSNKEIGAVLGVSANAVKACLKRTFLKLDVSSRAELAVLAASLSE